MKAQDILSAAAATMQQRGQQNGYDKEEERSAAEIARHFNQITSHAFSEQDAWRFMICLKEVRLKRQLANGSDIEDTVIDLLAYNALLLECISEKK